MIKTLALLFLLAQHGKPAKSRPQSPDNFSVAAIDWGGSLSGDQAHFDFPFIGGPVYQSPIGYFTTAHRGTISGSLSVTFTLTNTGAPVYVYQFPEEPGNTCTNPAHVRLWFARSGWYQNANRPLYRWWSNPAAYKLTAPGNTVTLTVPLQGALWSSVYGAFGNQESAAFAAALNDVSDIGFSFGGGCFFGHGVKVQYSSGTSTFQLNEYRVVR